jgi:pimeloyl-ACP methyl ester carboxylesterase
MKAIDRRGLLAAGGLALLGSGQWSRALADDRSSPATAATAPDAARVAARTGPSRVLVRRGYTDCRFGQLHYIRAAPVEGAGAKPPLVLLHQNPSSSVEYDALLRSMGTDREVVAFDTPGNGMSDWPPEPLDLAGYAGAFVDGIQGLSLGGRNPVDVFGYHTGTFLGAELAIALPDKVGRLVLSGIPFRTPEERQERLQEIKARPRITDSGEEILGQLRRLWTFVVTNRDPRVPLQRAADLFMEKAKPLDRYWWPYEGVWTYDVPQRFRLITQPVMILQPREALSEYSVKAAKFIPDVRIVEAPELERDVFDVGSAVIARKLREFLL